MVGDEGAIHLPDFDLQGISDEPAPNEIIVLSLEAFETAPLSEDLVVEIFLVVLEIVPDRCACSRLDLENVVIAILVDTPTINL